MTSAETGARIIAANSERIYPETGTIEASCHLVGSSVAQW